MKKLYRLIILFLGCGICDGQNLVPNPGFEEYENCPVDKGCIYYPGTYIKNPVYLKCWVSPNPGSPDYFNTCNKTNTEIGIPENLFGEQLPHSGNAFAGIIVFTKEFPECLECKEYLQVKLTEPLQSDNIYEASMYISLAEESAYVGDEIAMVFSNDSIFNRASLTMKYEPQISIRPGRNLAENADWSLISGKYKAKGGEQFLTIGNFIPSFKSALIKNGKRKKRQLSYYYIDDVSIIFTKYDSPDTVQTSTLIIEKTTIFNPDSLEKGDHVVLNSVYFELNKSQLLTTSYTELNALVSFLTANPAVNIEISGHTDNIGEYSHNFELSTKRAEAVYSYLIEQKISPQRVTYKGYGSEKPVADNNMESGRQRNRRVEFIVTNK